LIVLGVARRKRKRKGKRKKKRNRKRKRKRRNYHPKKRRAIGKKGRGEEMKKLKGAVYVLLFFVLLLQYCCFEGE
jgi:hypothetical protein